MRHLLQAVVVTVGILTSPTVAEELTDEKMLELFEAQRSAFEDAAISGMGRTRGLTIMAVGDLVQAEPGGDAAAPTPETYGALDRELQVNVRIGFGFDSASLSDDQRPVLDQICGVMKQSDINIFRIIGHTDAAGGDAYNERLSLLRAEEVRRHLIDGCGIAASRLEAIGLGKRFLFDAADPRGAVNRRVEFQALG